MEISLQLRIQPPTGKKLHLMQCGTAATWWHKLLSPHFLQNSPCLACGEAQIETQCLEVLHHWSQKQTHLLHWARDTARDSDSPRCSAWFGSPEEVPACCNCDNHRHDRSARGTAPLGLLTVTQAIGRRLWNTATTKLTTSEPNPFLLKTCFENSAPSVNFPLLTEKDQTFRKLPSQRVPVGSYSRYTAAESGPASAGHWWLTEFQTLLRGVTLEWCNETGGRLQAGGTSASAASPRGTGFVLETGVSVESWVAGEMVRGGTERYVSVFWKVYWKL